MNKIIVVCNYKSMYPSTMVPLSCTNELTDTMKKYLVKFGLGLFYNCKKTVNENDFIIGDICIIK